MVLSLAHVFSVDGTLMPKHVEAIPILLHVYDIVHLVGCNKQIGLYR
jgi:hypothetical protein